MVVYRVSYNNYEGDRLQNNSFCATVKDAQKRIEELKDMYGDDENIAIYDEIDRFEFNNKRELLLFLNNL
jgi:hypothetical protein